MKSRNRAFLLDVRALFFIITQAWPRTSRARSEATCGNWKSFKNDKNAFCLTLKALSVYEIFQISLWIFGRAGKLLDKKAMLNFKNYNVTNWLTNDYNTHTARYLKT